MKILVVGGGSGGHITPAVAVVREIIKEKPRAEVEFWTDPKYYKNVTKLTTEIGVAWGEEARRKKTTYIRVRKVPAGKFHRYANWHFRDYFVHFRLTVRELIVGNIIGFFCFLAGLVTSFCRLAPKRNRPNIIFLKGGYVCLPVGLIARLFKIPYIIHESDAVAGLANRVLMKKARKVAFGLPISEETQEKHPNYVWTGIPVNPDFKTVSPAQQNSYKRAFSFNANQPLVVITGGSQGSENLNEATRAILPELLKFTSVGLVAGRKHYEDMVDLKKYENWEKASLESNFRMWEFNTTMNELMGAADVVVSRAGATTIAELAALKKTVILVPFERLPGGHQEKNADRLKQAQAVSVISDMAMVADPTKLLDEIRHLIKSPKTRADMAERLHQEARTDAARRLAEIILEEA
ncbi:MAG: UDP-N-acetylglucosamine--N-acetylmuramyl-(pentapeptide) pyrophosphoryl-undecaprenol N-acetylglucosamine transferase [Candidatus Saccharibacteria bacterium]|nr:UDP-N-acetylglucosamine--N-acetylmuramyl-(pentapeptide) pyrophosphoryl-undecaprenol N-acetylglucosamine transferase [Candidatus Saccharibacteria bacterium]